MTEKQEAEKAVEAAAADDVQILIKSEKDNDESAEKKGSDGLMVSLASKLTPSIPFTRQ